MNQNLMIQRQVVVVVVAMFRCCTAHLPGKLAEHYSVAMGSTLLRHDRRPLRGP